jgi:uncharacterized membrane protein YqhA
MQPSQDPPPAGGQPPPTDGSRAVELGLRALRAANIAGVAALLVGSASLLLWGVVQTARQIVTFVYPSPGTLAPRDIFLSSIKLIDLVLLATIMQVVGIGLYSLFVGRDLPVPAWLRTTTVDELKRKLGGIVCVMLGVLFLEQVFYWGSERDLMPLGIAIAAVIFGLGFFLNGEKR